MSWNSIFPRYIHEMTRFDTSQCCSNSGWLMMVKIREIPSIKWCRKVNNNLRKDATKTKFQICSSTKTQEMILCNCLLNGCLLNKHVTTTTFFFVEITLVFFKLEVQPWAASVTAESWVPSSFNILAAQQLLLLMAEIRLTSWYGKYPIIYMVLYIPDGAGFLPSTVWVVVWLKIYVQTNSTNCAGFQTCMRNSLGSWDPLKTSWSCKDVNFSIYLAKKGHEKKFQQLKIPGYTISYLTWMFLLKTALAVNGCPPIINDCPPQAAHRRTVKLVHPDILGPDSGDLQVGGTRPPIFRGVAGVWWLKGSNLEGLFFVGKRKETQLGLFSFLYRDKSNCTTYPNSMR